MSSLKNFLEFFILIELASKTLSSSNCRSTGNELVCDSIEFAQYNASIITSDEVLSIRLINGFYSDSLTKSVRSLSIENYPFVEFSSEFSSPSLKFNFLLIEHSYLNVFPNWLCTNNRNLTSIEINYSDFESIVEHDLDRCENLEILKISNSNLRRFSSSSMANLSVESLFLNNNRFVTIGKPSDLDLRSFRRLKILNLSHNQLRFVSSLVFQHCVALKQVDFSFNDLEKFEIKQLTTVETIDLRENWFLQINTDWSNYFPKLKRISFPYAHFCCSHKNDLNQFHREERTRSAVNEPSNLISFHSDEICFPLPDPMTPCESLFSSNLIRSIFFIIVLTSVGSNLAALLINIIRLINSSYNRWPISTILSSNLAMADFISSIYLLLVGLIDIRFQDDFHNRTQLWTNSPLCRIASFIYIFGIQSSLYALTLLTFERFYTILFSFRRQTPWPPKFTLTSIAIGWLISFAIAFLPLINIDDFHSNSLCVPFRIETLFDRIYLSLLIVFDLSSLAIIIICNSLICFNFSKSHVHTSNDARATLKILTLVVTICISRIPLIIFISLALILNPTSARQISASNLHFHDIKLAILFLQPLSSCFNPFMYSSLSTLRWTSSTGFERPKPTRKSNESSRYQSQSERGYYPLRMMSISSLECRLSSLPNTP